MHRDYSTSQETRRFDAAAGFHLTNAGIDRNVALAEQICALEKERIRVANESDIILLQSKIEPLVRARRELQTTLAQAFKATTAHLAWPIWQTIMLVIFLAAGFAFTRMSFEPFDLDPELLWICSAGISCLCAYGTAEFLEKTDLKVILLALSIVLFVSSLAGLTMLASVRGDLFALHLQNLPSAGDAQSTAHTDRALAFYAAAGPKMRLFLTLLSLSLELAAGLALHAVRVALKARSLQPSAESRRLEIVEQEIGRTEAEIRFLRNEPDAFEYEYLRNVHIGLLAGAVRHARSSRTWPATVAFLAVLGSGFTLRGQPIDLWEALDYSATSKAAGYDGRVACAENIEAAAQIIETLPRGSRVTVSAISDQSFARPSIILAGDVPASPGNLREFDQVVAVRNQLAASLLTHATLIKPEFQTTDILGSLIVAGMAFRDAPHMRHVLVIHSDMRQSAVPLDIEHVRLVPLKAALATLEQEHLFADLSGADIFVYGVHSIGKDIKYWQSLRDFWTAYFERCHARLRAFTMMREIPDFNESR